MTFFYAIDGDDIGRALEHLILIGEVDGLRNFSRRCRGVMTEISNALESIGCEVVFCEGDSIFALSNRLVDLSDILPKNGEFSFSTGIGCRPDLAFLALKKAKGLGKCRIEILMEDFR